MRGFAISLIMTGFLLMALSPLWPSVASSSLFWDDASALDYAESVANLHQAHTQASIENEDADVHTAETHTLGAEQRFNEAQRKLADARQFRNRGGTIMRWLGAAIAVIGLGIYKWHESRTE